MSKKPRIYVKKVYPVKGRKDFCKYVVMNGAKVHQVLNNKGQKVDGYFNSRADAQAVAAAARKVRKINALWAKKR